MSKKISLSNLSFTEVKVKTDVTEIYKKIDKFAEESKGKDCREVLDSVVKILRMPVEQDVEAFVEKLGEKSVFSGLVNTIIVDEANNPIVVIPPEKKKEYDKTFRYLLYLKYYSLLSKDVFNKLKENGFPIFRCILDRLKANPLLAEHFPFIEAGILEHIEGHFMASILILGLRIEGILRSILKKHNIDTLRVFKNGTVEEKTLGRLFGIKKLQKIIGNDLYQYLHVLLIKKEGQNIRNGLAHSLIRYDEFNEELSSLLILTLLFMDQKITTIP